VVNYALPSSRWFILPEFAFDAARYMEASHEAQALSEDADSAEKADYAEDIRHRSLDSWH
jgi:hypothetical protein